MGDNNNHGLNILYIEDDLAVQTLFRFYFKKWDHKLEYVSEGNSALNFLNENKYDLILMDWSLPTSPSGQKLIDSIRQIRGYEVTPIIVVSGYDNRGDLRGLKEETINGFLNKPINKSELKKVIDDIE